MEHQGYSQNGLIDKYKRAIINCENSNEGLSCNLRECNISDSTKSILINSQIELINRFKNKILKDSVYTSGVVNSYNQLLPKYNQYKDANIVMTYRLSKVPKKIIIISSIAMIAGGYITKRYLK